LIFFCNELTCILVLVWFKLSLIKSLHILKFDAMWQMQNIDCDSQPTSGDSNADSMAEPLLVIRQTFGWGVTNARNNWKNYIMASLVSPSTIAKANGNMLRFPS